jgi:hypothetical protein
VKTTSGPSRRGFARYIHIDIYLSIGWEVAAKRRSLNLKRLLTLDAKTVEDRKREQGNTEGTADPKRAKIE